MTDSSAPVRPDRRAELAAGLAQVRARIADACAAAGRDRAEVTMIAVTKTYPASDVVALAGLGVHRHGGEPGPGGGRQGGRGGRRRGATPLALHRPAAAQQGPFGGPLRRRGALGGQRPAGPALAAAAGRTGSRPLDVLVQVSIDGDAARGGALPGAADPERGLDPVAEALAGAGRCGWPG